jgi:hypothetical protein
MIETRHVWTLILQLDDHDNDDHPSIVIEARLCDHGSSRAGIEMALSRTLDMVIDQALRKDRLIRVGEE